MSSLESSLMGFLHLPVEHGDFPLTTLTATMLLVNPKFCWLNPNSSEMPKLSKGKRLTHMLTIVEVGKAL